MTSRRSTGAPEPCECRAAVPQFAPRSRGPERRLRRRGARLARALTPGPVIDDLYANLGGIREALLLDAGAIYDGDPAAHSIEEVILAYPGFLAIATYQGVTLGAARVAKHLEHTKRHPTIGDDVVIYANATILGGDTVIGRGSVVGGNVWLTRSVPPYSVVSPTARVEHRGGHAGASDDLIEFNI